MSKGGNGRDWGYASYDMDDPESEKLVYTSYENSGRVNQYPENDGGGHGHYTWENKEDHDLGKDADSGREASNTSTNPSTGEIQQNGGCYLTSACIKYFNKNFDNHCYELQILRWFRDNFVSEEDIQHYYEIAPQIVHEIDKRQNASAIYIGIYKDIIKYCVCAIENGQYQIAYDRYKTSILKLEELFARPALNQRLVDSLYKKLVLKIN